MAEIWRGILQMPAGKRQRDLEDWFQGAEGPQHLFAGRVLAFDDQAGLIWARLMAEGTALAASPQRTRHDHRGSGPRQWLHGRHR